jgi:hypothetical protein
VGASASHNPMDLHGTAKFSDLENVYEIKIIPWNRIDLGKIL